MKGPRSRQLRFVLVPLMAVSLLAACGGYRVQQWTPKMESWTPTMKRPSAADLMIMPTAERLAFQTRTSRAGAQPNRGSAGGKVAVVAAGVLTAMAVVADLFEGAASPPPDFSSAAHNLLKSLFPP